jgi:hypothetical protein
MFVDKMLLSIWLLEETWFFGATRLVGSLLRGCDIFCWDNFVNLLAWVEPVWALLMDSSRWREELRRWAGFILIFVEWELWRSLLSWGCGACGFKGFCLVLLLLGIGLGPWAGGSLFEFFLEPVAFAPWELAVCIMKLLCWVDGGTYVLFLVLWGWTDSTLCTTFLFGTVGSLSLITLRSGWEAVRGVLGGQPIFSLLLWLIGTDLDLVLKIGVMFFFIWMVSF